MYQFHSLVRYEWTTSLPTLVEVRGYSGFGVEQINYFSNNKLLLKLLILAKFYYLTDPVNVVYFSLVNR